MGNTIQATHTPIKTQLVPTATRAFVLAKAIPNLYLVFENRLYQLMATICPDYRVSHGYWDFYTLSNSGFYFSWASLKPQVQVTIPFGNDFSGTMSADAASIVANIMAYSWLVESHQAEFLFDRIDQLRALAYEHPEATLIFRALD